LWNKAESVEPNLQFLTTNGRNPQKRKKVPLKIPSNPDSGLIPEFIGVFLCQKMLILEPSTNQLLQSSCAANQNNQKQRTRIWRETFFV